MQQLRLSSPALGSCIPNLGYFLASNNLVKSENLENTFTGREISPLAICHPNISVRSPFTFEILFSQVRPFLALLLNLGHFGHFSPASTSFIQNLLGSKTVARMMKI